MTKSEIEQNAIKKMYESKTYYMARLSINDIDAVGNDDLQETLARVIERGISLRELFGVRYMMYYFEAIGARYNIANPDEIFDYDDKIDYYRDAIEAIPYIRM